MGNRVYIETQISEAGPEICVEDNYDDSGWVLIDPKRPIDPDQEPFEILRLAIQENNTARDILEAALENDTQVVMDGESLSVSAFFRYAQAQSVAQEMDSVIADPSPSTNALPKPRL